MGSACDCKSQWKSDLIWKKIVNNFLLEQFGFDIEAKCKQFEKLSSHPTKLSSLVTLSSTNGSEEIDFATLRGTCLKNIHVQTGEIQNKFSINCLPASTEIIQINKTSRLAPSTYPDYPDLIVEPVDDDDNDNDDNNNDNQDIQESIQYTDVADDDDSAFPLSIYDLEGDEDLKFDEDDDEQSNFNDETTATQYNYAVGGDEINEVDDDDEAFDPNCGSEGGEIEYYASLDSQDGSESQFYEPEDTEEYNAIETNTSKQKGRIRKSLIVRISNPGEATKFQCTECNRFFSDRGNGHRHVRRLHRGKSVRQMMAADIEGTEPLPSSSSSPVKFDDSPPLLEPQVPVKIKCENPELGKLTKEQRIQASKLIRRIGNKYECKECRRTFSISCNARRHARVVHFGERLYSCQNCSKLFSSKTDGIIHEKICKTRLDKAQEKQQSGIDQGQQDNAVNQKSDEVRFEMVGVGDNDFMDDDEEMLNGPANRAPVSIDSIANRKDDGKLMCKLCEQVGVISQFENSTAFAHHSYYAHKKRVFEHQRQAGSACPKCSRNFDNDLTMKAHYLACVKKARPVAEAARARLSSSAKQVPRKLKKTYSLKGKQHVLSQGIIRKVDTYYECRICRNTYEDIQSGLTHAKRMHLTSKPHCCKNCPKSYFNKKDFLKHQLKCSAIPTEAQDGMEKNANTNNDAIFPPSTSLSAQMIYGLDISEVNDNTNEEPGQYNFGTGNTIQDDDNETESTYSTNYPFNFLELTQTQRSSDNSNSVDIGAGAIHVNLNNIISITEVSPPNEHQQGLVSNFSNSIISNGGSNYSKARVRKHSLV